MMVAAWHDEDSVALPEQLIDKSAVANKPANGRHETLIDGWMQG